MAPWICTTSTSVADVERLVGHVGAGAPLLAPDLDPPAAAVDPLENDRLRALERRGAGPDRARHRQVAPGDRAQEADRSERADAEDDDLQPDRSAQGRDHGGGQRSKGDRAEEEEPRCEDLADREQHGDDGPDDPSWHARKITPLDRRTAYPEPHHEAGAPGFAGSACLARLRRRCRGGDLPAAGARDHFRARSRDQPGHPGLPHAPAHARGERRLRRRRDPPRHARRPLDLDEDDLPGRAGLEGTGDRLRVTGRRPRRLGRRLGRPGGRRPRHGADDEHRLVDADRLERQEPRLGPAPQGDQRRRRLAQRSRGRQSPRIRRGRRKPCATRRTSRPSRRCR